MVGREHGRLNNQEGTLTPTTSPYGQLLRAATSLLIAQPAPIGRQNDGAFHGTVGGIATRSASVVALFAPGGYFGDAPSGLQPLVSAPEPWNRP